MAIIYSYPTVTPTSDDLILGTDINADGKPTKIYRKRNKEGKIDRLSKKTNKII